MRFEMFENAGPVVLLIFLAFMFVVVFLHPTPKGAEKPNSRQRRSWLASKSKTGRNA